MGGGGGYRQTPKERTTVPEETEKVVRNMLPSPQATRGQGEGEGRPVLREESASLHVTGEVSQFTCYFLCYLNHTEGLEVEDTLPNSLSGAAEHWYPKPTIYSTMKESHRPTALT